MSIKKKYNDFINIIDENINNLQDLNTKKVWSNTSDIEKAFSINNIEQLPNKNALPVVEKLNETNKKCVCDTSSSDDYNNIDNIIKNNFTSDSGSSYTEYKSSAAPKVSATLQKSSLDFENKDSTELQSNNNLSSKLEEVSSQKEKIPILDNSISTQRVFDNSYDYVTNQNVNNHQIDQSIAEESFQKSEGINEFDILINYDHKIEEDMNTINNQLDNLENLFNKTIMKKNNKNIKDNQNNINYKKNNLFKGDILKHICSDIEEKIFIESTRGFNLRENIFKLRIDKLKENLKNYNPSSNITVGYIYRDFNNIKSYMNSDINTYWLNVYKTSDIITEKYLDPNSKLLQSCLKNLANNNKFKKKINSETIRAFKKTIEINNIIPKSSQTTHLIENQNMQHNYSSIIIDIIFYTKNIINNTNI
jgi:hypothetical protein